MEDAPADELVIDDLETLKVVADPLRMDILELLTRTPLTVTQIGEQLDMAPSRLYYHVNLLEKHGLLRLVETRMVSNMMEKYYAPVAPSLRLDPKLFSFSEGADEEGLSTLLDVTLESTRQDIVRSIRAGVFDLARLSQERRGTIGRVASRLKRADAQRLLARIEELIAEFDAADDEAAGEPYGLTVAFFPRSRYGAGDETTGPDENTGPTGSQER